GGPWPPGFNNV
ncbi:hypothetical protein MIMGU_mgv1a0142542mg, partial [Erythranthe guttata]